jgi:hypothetical protein
MQSRKLFFGKLAFQSVVHFCEHFRIELLLLVGPRRFLIRLMILMEFTQEPMGQSYIF